MRLQALVLCAAVTVGCQRQQTVRRPEMGARPMSVVPPSPHQPEEPEERQLSHEEHLRMLVSEIEEPLRIRLFVRGADEDGLSAELERVCRGLLEIARVPGRIDVQNPVEDEARAEEARQLGVLPLGTPLTRRRVDSLPPDADYRAMIIAIGSRFMVVPQVTADRGAVEFQVAEAISRFLHGPRLVGVVTTPERQRELIKLRRVLDRLDVRQVDLAEPLSEDLSALLIVAPELGAEEVASVRHFLERGRAVAFLLDGMEVEPQPSRLRVRPVRSGLTKLLGDYGVELGRNLVFDRRCARVSVPARVGRMLVTYPPLPIAEVPDQTVVPDARAVQLPFPSTVVATSRPGQTTTELLRSSDQSWVQSRGFDLSPHQQWEASGMLGPYVLGVAIESEEERGPRLAVVGNARFVEDRYLDFDDNALFVRQLIEWLGGHRALSGLMFEERSEVEVEAPSPSESSEPPD